MESQLYFDDVLPWCREAETLKGSGIRWQNPPASGIKSDCGCLSISTCLPTMHFSGMRPSKFKVKMSDAFFSAIIKKDLSTSTLPIHGLIWALSAPRRRCLCSNAVRHNQNSHTWAVSQEWKGTNNYLELRLLTLSLIWTKILSKNDGQSGSALISSILNQPHTLKIFWRVHFVHRRLIRNLVSQD